MHGLRVTGGTLRGRKLRVDAGAAVRPTSERARQAYFNIVAAQVPDARFLDLYAGSGIFSFEAVSRGAREAVALDMSRKNVATIESTAQGWDVSVRAETARLPEGLAGLANKGAFDLVYADPPYNLADYPKLLENISESVPLSAEAIVAVEHRTNAKARVSEGTNRLRYRRTNSYGNVSITFFDLREPNEHE
jgi:16S rRNA (guanine(966)-N(2))-methyltransferase RsmD